MEQTEVGLATVEFTAEGRSDPLLSGFGDAMQTFQWHSAEVKDTPSGTVVLARNQACPIQADRYRNHNTISLRGNARNRI